MIGEEAFVEKVKAGEHLFLYLISESLLLIQKAISKVLLTYHGVIKGMREYLGRLPQVKKLVVYCFTQVKLLGRL